MKKLLIIIAAMITAASCNTKKVEPKTLVLYYSQTSNTKTVAEEIQARLNADIEAIEAVVPYDGDFQATIKRSGKEREEGVLPEIKPIAHNIAEYDVIFLGYPVWFGTYAPPVATFLNQVDLAGKKVVPFCTFGSGGLDSSVKDLKAKQPNAEIVPGYGVRAARLAKAKDEIDRFLKENGFIEGEVVKLEDFPEHHPVTEEEAAIFDAAVDGYPMLSAKAESVAMRTIPGGKEYLFTAVPLPREEAAAPKAAPKDNARPPMPMNPLKVYVTVFDGQQPEFTQVIR